MYIATHLGWVVLSCAVLMFFRKRSIKKKKEKKCQVEFFHLLAQPRWDRAPGRSQLEDASSVVEGKGQAQRGLPGPRGTLSQGSPQALCQRWFLCTQSAIGHSFPVASCASQQPATITELLCSGYSTPEQGGLVMHRANQYRSLRIGRDAISGLRVA